MVLTLMECVLCNESAIKMLGYDSQEEMLGKNMHQLIHHSYRDGQNFLLRIVRL